MAKGNLRVLSAEVLVAQVYQHHVIVGATGNHTVASVHECLGHHCRVLLHTYDVVEVIISERLVEGHCLGRDDVLQWATLCAGEDGAVQQ